MRRLLTFCVLMFLSASTCWGQQDLNEFLMQPARGGPPIFDFNKLAMAKFYEKAGEPHLVFLVDQFRTEKREVNATKFRTEQRTRTVQVTRPDGESENVEQTYTVKVPYVERQEATVLAPAGEKPVTVSFDKLRIYRLDGTRVTPEEAAQLLKALRPVFVASLKNGVFESPTEIVRKVLDPQTLVVLTDEVQLGRPALLGIPVDIPLPPALVR